MTELNSLSLAISCLIADAMKAKIWVLGLVTVLAVVLVVQQVVIQSHRDRIAALEEMLAGVRTGRDFPAKPRQIGAPSASPGEGRKVGGRTAESRPPAGRPGESGDESLGQSLRRMSENPAGRAMMNQGIKAMSAMWFADLVDEFELTREEEDYFLRLVAGGMSSQQQVGMKIMTAETDAEREALQAEVAEAQEATREAVRDFLNNDEDFAAYELYNRQLPERQQLEGLRNTMLEAGAPLTREQEQGVIEAMYKVRTTKAATTNWQGPGGMEAIASGDAIDKFEQEWQENSRATEAEVAKILEEEQLNAFRQFQTQMKDMQLMGIKMAEKMFQSKKDRPTGDE